MTGDELNREFWLIILESWTFGEIDILESRAKDCEKSINW